MHRLSLKRLIVLVSMIGLVFGFMPTTSAHKNTNAEAVVVGEVVWPKLPKVGSAEAHEGFDLKRGISSQDLSLDLRAVGSGATKEGGKLNGCRLKDGNTFEGLPLEGKTHDLCFLFGDLEITATGIWESNAGVTTFECASTGTTGASGHPDNAVGGELGASYGEFVCNGDGIVPRADGHFHLLSKQGTIAFLGEVNCPDPTPEDIAAGKGAPCPKEPEKAETFGKDHRVSRIKHTLACKGQVRPGPKVGNLNPAPWIFPKQDVPFSSGGVPLPNAGAINPVDGTPDDRQTLVSALVNLECVIA